MSASVTGPRPPLHTPAPSACARAMKPREPVLPASAASQVNKGNAPIEPDRGHRARARRKDYFGRTEWNIDFAADSTSSATDGRPCGWASTASARKSSGGRGSGISAGGLGRCGSSGRAAGGYGGLPSGGVETRIGGGNGWTGGAPAGAGDGTGAGAAITRGASGARAGSLAVLARCRRSIAARARSLASGIVSAGAVFGAAITGSAGNDEGAGAGTAAGAVLAAAFSRAVG